MHKPSARHLGSQLTIAVRAVVAIALTGGGFAFAQEAPEAGVGVAEALAGPNTVNSAAIVNGSVTGQDIATGTIGVVTSSRARSRAGPRAAGSTTGTLLSGRAPPRSSHVGTGSTRSTSPAPSRRLRLERHAERQRRRRRDSGLDHRGACRQRRRRQPVRSHLQHCRLVGQHPRAAAGGVHRDRDPPAPAADAGRRGPPTGWSVGPSRPILDGPAWPTATT